MEKKKTHHIEQDNTTGNETVAAYIANKPKKRVDIYAWPDHKRLNAKTLLKKKKNKAKKKQMKKKKR